MNSKQYKTLEAMKKMHPTSKFVYADIQGYTYVTRTSDGGRDASLYEIDKDGKMEDVMTPPPATEVKRISNDTVISPIMLIAASRNITKRNEIFVKGEAFVSNDGCDKWSVLINDMHGSGYGKKYEISTKNLAYDEPIETFEVTIGQLIDLILYGYLY